VCSFFVGVVTQSIMAVTTKEAADRLGVSPRRVRQLVKEGRLNAEYHGRDLAMDESSLERYIASRRQAEDEYVKEHYRADDRT
jgi:excisionase family DNA binding protein